MRPTKPAKTVHRARQLRKDMSLPERLLWQILKTCPGGLKFRRQHPAGPYILDFFCARAKVAIEIDGFAHDTANRPDRDDIRDFFLARHQIQVLHIRASDVLRNPADIATEIITTIEAYMRSLGKAPPSSRRDATSPSLTDGEEKDR